MWLLLLSLVTGNRWQVTSDTWHVTCDTLHYKYILFFSFFFFLIPVLLFANFERFRVFCMMDFCLHRFHTFFYFIKTVFRSLSPFKIGTNISLEQSVWADLSWNPFRKCIASICLWSNQPGNCFWMEILKCWSYFQFLPWNWVFWTYMESNAAVTLYFKDLAVTNYLFLKDVCICWLEISNSLMK